MLPYRRGLIGRSDLVPRLLRPSALVCRSSHRSRITVASEPYQYAEDTQAENNDEDPAGEADVRTGDAAEEGESGVRHRATASGTKLCDTLDGAVKSGEFALSMINQTDEDGKEGGTEFARLQHRTRTRCTSSRGRRARQ